MRYNIVKPVPPLQSLIDVYFQISGRLSNTEFITLLPEGGVNLFVNLGECIHSTGLDKKINHGGIYLVGPMMKSDVQIIRNEALLFGVRFKPGAFSYFHRYDSLDQIANSFQEFTPKLFPDIKKIISNFAAYLDEYYLHKLSAPKNSVLNCVTEIHQKGGSVNIETLARKHFMSERQLERLFKQQVGVSPKKFADLQRFHQAFGMLNSRVGCSMEEIAWDCGYYDHAHLTNDFKRYIGQPPSAFFLSDFSKMIIKES